MKYQKQINWMFPLVFGNVEVQAEKFKILMMIMFGTNLPFFNWH